MIYRFKQPTPDGYATSRIRPSNRPLHYRPKNVTFSVRHAVKEAPRFIDTISALHKRNIMTCFYTNDSEQFHLLLIKHPSLSLELSW